MCIAVIWAPGERTQLYALYSQPNQMDDGSGDVEMAGMPGNDFQINDGSSDDDYDNSHVAPYRDADGSGPGTGAGAGPDKAKDDGQAPGDQDAAAAAGADDVKVNLGDDNVDDGDSDGFGGDLADDDSQIGPAPYTAAAPSKGPAHGGAESDGGRGLVVSAGGDAVLGAGDILDSGSDDGDSGDDVALTAAGGRA